MSRKSWAAFFPRAVSLSGAGSVIAALLIAASTPAGAVTTLTRTSSFTYDTVNAGMLMQEVIEPDQPTLKLQTDYTYDAFGNRLTKTVSGSGVTARATATAYDTQGRFPTTVTDALSHQSSQTFNTLFGGVATSTDQNGLVTQTQYDAFGRKTLEIAPDGTRVKWTYLYCSGVNGGTATCPANAVYLVKRTPLASDGTTQIGPISTVYCDRLQREFANETQGLDGSAIRQVTTYDANGHVASTSRPYFVSGGTQRLTTYTYDGLGRVLTETTPDNGVISHSYNGLTTVDTNALNQTKTTVRNSQGLTVSVTDNLNHATTYVYDPFENLTRTTDSGGHLVTATYDLRGRKTASSDPDMGSWTYGYNVFSELVSQTNARSQATSLTYDKLGRLTGKTEVGLSSTWTYDTQTNGIGKPATTSTTAGFQRTYSYDTLGRPTGSAETVDGTTYTTSVGYDTSGHITSATYPSGFAVTYAYAATTGYLKQVKDSVSGLAYWTANTADAEGSLTQVTYGNGIVTTNGYDPNTGLLTSRRAGTSNATQDASFTYDLGGNLTQRADAIMGVTDTLTYDGLNRLTQVDTSNPSQLFSGTKTVAYDAIGNITSKSDVGLYTYLAAHPHQVTGVSGTLNTTYSYDNDGNMTGGGGRTITWTSFDMAAQIAQGTTTLAFTYDSDHARIKQTSSDGSSKYYLNDTAIGTMSEKLVGSTGTVTWIDYISAGSGPAIAMRIAGTTTAVQYLHRDHLGSVAVLTDATGNVVERDSYDAWGKRRNATGVDDSVFPGIGLTSMASRGFTGQEQLDSVALVHFNGRIYDPVIGRFVSADPIVQEPDNSQSLNRYSYVLNNPLSATDPSGYLFGFVKKLFKKLFKLPGLKQLGDFLKHSMIGRFVFDAGLVALGVLTGQPELFAIADAILETGFNGGSLGQALKAAALSFASAEAFSLLGSITQMQNAVPGDFLQARHIADVIGHGILGCALSAANGGDCASGAFSEAATSFVGPIVGQLGIVGGLASSSVIGGTSSVIGGGKFANGAKTAAFHYLYSKAGEAYQKDGFNGLLDYAGKLWALPDSAIGLVAGAAGLPFGASLGQPQHNATVFTNYPFGPGGAITFGNVILYTESSLGDMVPTYGARLGTSPASDVVQIGNHEEGHTYQYQVLGPFFLPVYGVSGIGKKISPLESAADKYGQTGKGWWPW